MTQRSRLHVDWLKLPDELLFHIAVRLSQTDSVRFGAVCLSLHAVYANLRRNQSHKLPMLMLPTERDRDEQTCSLYNLTDKRVCDLQLQVPHDLACIGSFHGWLTIVNNDEEVSLFNPFMETDNKNKIDLPPVRALDLHEWEAQAPPFDFRFMTKAVLSANPAVNPNYVVVAMYAISAVIAYFKPGNNVWIAIDIGSTVEDFIYYRDQFYAMDADEVVCYDVNQNPPRKTKLHVPAPPLPPPVPLRKKRSPVHRYLVEVSGELWQVQRVYAYLDEHNYHCRHARCFDVYRLDFVGLRWVKMDDLQGHSVFIGSNSSFSVLASDFPECKPDSIYFTDEFCRSYVVDAHDLRDMGVFNIKDRTFEKHCPIEQMKIFPLPIWIEPLMS